MAFPDNVVNVDFQKNKQPEGEEEEYNATVEWVDVDQLVELVEKSTKPVITTYFDNNGLVLNVQKVDEGFLHVDMSASWFEEDKLGHVAHSSHPSGIELVLSWETLYSVMHLLSQAAQKAKDEASNDNNT